MHPPTHEQIRQAIVDGDVDEARKLAEALIEQGADLLDAVEHGFSAGIRRVGDLWEEGEYFLPELVTAAQAITAALFARERGQGGQHVKLAMLDTMVAYLWPEGMAGYTFIGKEVKASRAQFAQDLIFETQDGYITAGAISDQEWQGMCEALEKPEWLEDERFRTASTRIRNGAIRLEMTAEVLKTNTSDYWLERLDSRSVPCAPVLTRPQVIEQEQVKVNGQLFEYDHPGLGRVRQPRSAAQFDRTPTNTEPLAPRLGEHGHEILSEYGYAEEKITALVSDGILKLPSD